MYGVVAVVQPGVGLTNHISNPRSPPKRKPLALKLPSDTHPASGAFSRPSGPRDFQPSYRQYLQGGVSRGEFLLRAKEEKRNIITPPSDDVAGNCFGEVVSNAMLVDFGMPQTQENRARLALRLMNDDDKKGQASRYVANLKDMYGYGSSTLCLVYNATGDTLHHHVNHDWFQSGLHQHGYPEEIGNGQWAAFLHVSKSRAATTGSVGAVVYRGRNKNGLDRDFLLAWDTPCSLTKHNKAYCTIGDVNSHNSRWDEIQSTLEGSSYTSSSRSAADGVEVDVQTERGTSPSFTAIIKLRVRDQ